MLEIKRISSWADGGEQYMKGSAVEYEALSYYSSRQLRSRYFVKNNKFDGVCTVCHENGNKQREETYIDGKLNGISRTWHDNGGLRTHEPYRQGRLFGIFREWDRTGTLIKVRVVYFSATLPLSGMTSIDYKVLRFELTAKEVVEERILGLRRILMNDFGNERLVHELGAVVIDDAGDHQLLRINLPNDEEPLMVVKCDAHRLVLIIRSVCRQR
ncbi:MAG: hypothetical protein HQL22_08455 [Candidatus Omnitrophica bacterium]|nr:hypothetical protein [Candidatus Omnitrophota bacterium]